MRLLQVTLYLLIAIYLSTAIYNGITTQPTEVDSTSYHIPMAYRVLDGTIMNPGSFDFPNPTYPGSTELILSLFVALHIPLNLFNVAAWILLGIVLYKCTKRLGLNHTTALVCVSSIVFLPTMIRLLPTQTADIWLNVFFVWLVYLLLKPEGSYKYFGFLGTAAGMLAGAKFSGPIFMIAACIVLGKKVWEYLTFQRVCMFIIPFVLGASWYLRNWFYYGNPLYPSPFLFFRGVDNFSRYMQPHWHTMLFYKNGLMQTMNAWLSEYLIFIFAPVMCVISWLKMNHKHIKPLILLGLLGFIVYLIIPGYPFNYSNIVSEVRYGHPAMILWIMTGFTFLQSAKLITYILPVLLINSVAFLLPLPYKPKLYIGLELALIATALIVYIYRKKSQNSFSKE